MDEKDRRAEREPEGLGLRRGTVSVVPHRDEWEQYALQTIGLLREILRDAAVDIQHVGSTAIKGICAKPIIDIAVGTADIGGILDMRDALGEKGFIFRGQDIPGQYLFVRGEGETRTHHIHVVRYGGADWNNYINMRDYLNCHEDDAREYSELKRELAARYPDDRAAYTAMKSGLIGRILDKAREWRSGSDG